MDNCKPKRPPRPPPKLRTKTGCHKCRERRKKCDEKKPKCGACTKLQLHCSYRESAWLPGPPSNHSRSSATTPDPEDQVVDLILPSPQSSTLSFNPSVLMTKRDWMVFQYASTRFIQLLTTPDARDEFRDVSFVFAMGFYKPWVMHAILAPAALHASCAALMPQEDAMVYTESALRGLRKAIEQSELTADKGETFLAASLFLGVFEDFYSDPASHCLTHYKAVARVLEEETVKTCRLDLDRLSAFRRTLLDSVLYHFATRLILEEDVDAICESFPSQTIAMYIDALENMAQQGHETSSVLPVLGRCKPSLFLLIYQITWLSRQVPLDLHSSNHTLALQCLEELDKLFYSHPLLQLDDLHSFGDDAPRTLTNTDIAAKLYFLATKMFLLKVLSPDQVRTTSSQVSAMLQQAFELLKCYDGAADCAQFICWAVLVLGCAACPTTHFETGASLPIDIGAEVRRKMRNLIQRKLLQIWETSYSGYVKRTADALGKIWSLPSLLVRDASSFSSETEAEYDGMNALIYGGGLGQALLFFA
ncbi:hypothetical protein PV08_10272 [Exophiala spinifera]|uniref:Zn(2)-C6 fungal-type domain-containing protein n=1 Tax=Exophiala spinifera TaxID=91928 RepID=A0A0D2AW68_9EURO|nr:uncharacterized protein PV08_10272 [Exophiala spinifera]KIW10973.1 hypothetical protein PV08_10272 [Exophiala spinifera]